MHGVQQRSSSVFAAAAGNQPRNCSPLDKARADGWRFALIFCAFLPHQVQRLGALDKQRVSARCYRRYCRLQEPRSRSPAAGCRGRSARGDDAERHPAGDADRLPGGLRSPGARRICGTTRPRRPWGISSWRAGPTLVLIAPATAHLMSQLASGSAGNLLTTLCLATSSARRARTGHEPGHVAPCGHAGQSRHARVPRCALYRPRRPAARPVATSVRAGWSSRPNIVGLRLAAAAQHEANFSQRPAGGLRVLVTAGPTREPIDPVRFISNRSSGKMGFAVAQAAAGGGRRSHADCRSGAPARPRRASGAVDVETAEPRCLLPALEQCCRRGHLHRCGGDFRLPAGSRAARRSRSARDRLLLDMQQVAGSAGDDRSAAEADRSRSALPPRPSASRNTPGRSSKASGST